MEKMLKYERPKLVDLTSKEWENPFAQGITGGTTQKDCTDGGLAYNSCGQGYSGRK